MCLYINNREIINLHFNQHKNIIIDSFGQKSNSANMHHHSNTCY